MIKLLSYLYAGLKHPKIRSWILMLLNTYKRPLLGFLGCSTIVIVIFLIGGITLVQYIIGLFTS